MKMDSPALIYVCSASFIAVFVLLAALAIVMRLIIMAFPEKLRKADAAVVAAVSATYSSLFPGTTITKIEEMK